MKPIEEIEKEKNRLQEKSIYLEEQYLETQKSKYNDAKIIVDAMLNILKWVLEQFQWEGNMNYMKEKSIEQIKEELKKLEKQAAYSGCFGWYMKMTGGLNEIRRTA